MRNLSLLQRFGVGLMALLVFLGIAAGASQVMAAPADYSSAAFSADSLMALPLLVSQQAQASNETKCQEHKQNRIAALERKMGDVQKRIDDLKARIVKADKPEKKDKLQKKLDAAQEHLKKLQDRLQKVRDINCATKSSNPAPAPTTTPTTPPAK